LAEFKEMRYILKVSEYILNVLIIDTLPTKKILVMISLQTFQ